MEAHRRALADQDSAVRSVRSRWSGHSKLQYWGYPSVESKVEAMEVLGRHPALFLIRGKYVSTLTSNKL